MSNPSMRHYVDYNVLIISTIVDNEYQGGTQPIDYNVLIISTIVDSS